MASLSILVEIRKNVYYYPKNSFGSEKVMWTKPSEPLRDTQIDEKLWRHPSLPDNVTDDKPKTVVWLRHKLVLKNEDDQYYFSKLGDDGDIMCTTSFER